MKKRLCSFTLVELLVVMAIMAMLLYIATPAFEKMAKGGGSELAARNIYNYLSLSRNYAITNRQFVAVLFPMKGSTDYPSSGIPSNYYNSSYRACLVK
ncbi:MAG TPA: prepilin-type N-terminal cleavage/methylation domain-containing protein, partial [Victivallales bacterium]|nr:prepilin-type N-terminal cleavage/methylation domain-containing protein [Victivallales bacterium]